MLCIWTELGIEYELGSSAQHITKEWRNNWREYLGALEDATGIRIRQQPFSPFCISFNGQLNRPSSLEITRSLLSSRLFALPSISLHKDIKTLAPSYDLASVWSTAIYAVGPPGSCHGVIQSGTSLLSQGLEGNVLENYHDLMPDTKAAPQLHTVTW